MKRISTATSVANKFGPGKSGFTNGSVVGGVPATELEADWFDHIQEELANVIEALGIALDPSSKTQLLLALRGRQIAVRPFTSSAVYVPTPGTTFVEVEVVGAGAAGGGVPTTTATQIAIGAGGTSGARAIGFFPVAQVAGQPIVVGAAGMGVAGATGGAGGASSIGGVISANGGTPGSAGGAGASSGLNGSGTTPTSTGGYLNERGRSSRVGLAVYGQISYGGDGADGPHGSGGGGANGLIASNSSAVGQPATGYGAGGGGAQTYDSNTTPRAGGNGSPGIVIIKEFA